VRTPQGTQSQPRIRATPNLPRESPQLPRRTPSEPVQRFRPVPGKPQHRQWALVSSKPSPCQPLRRSCLRAVRGVTAVPAAALGADLRWRCPPLLVRRRILPRALRRADICLQRPPPPSCLTINLKRSPQALESSGPRISPGSRRIRAVQRAKLWHSSRALQAEWSLTHLPARAFPFAIGMFERSPFEWLRAAVK
jgi:hypothetical protein